MIIDGEVYLAHYGVKGMRWGVIRKRLESNKELKETVSKNEAAEDATRSDPTFKREVAATRKGQGIRSDNPGGQSTKKYGRITGRMTGDFFNSKGEPVSADFANAVLRQAVKENKRMDLSTQVGKKAVASAMLVFGTYTLAKAFKLDKRLGG
jgi:hypothetical protein